MKLECITPDWSAPKNVGCIVTTRVGGCSVNAYQGLNLSMRVGDNEKHVQKNRQLIKQQLLLPSDPVWLNQVHSSDVLKLSSSISENPTVDAAYTNEVGIVCAVLTADCLPVLFCDREGECVAVAHAGWRGLAAGVLENTLHAMPVNTAQIICWLGPAIGPGKFEVGSEVQKAFIDKDAEHINAFQQTANGKFLADIYQLALNTLSALGVDVIYGGGYCTYTDKQRFFSYRRDGKTGRMATLIWKK